jgi:Transketolase, C-terminal domain
MWSGSEDEDLSILACGPMVPEAMRAAYILEKEFGYETRVLNLHTLKPIDAEAIIRAAKETGVIVTAEEHQIGALAWRVSGILTESEQLYGVPVITGAIGVKDRFGDSGRPLGTDQGIRSQRRTYRPSGLEIDGRQEGPRGRAAGRCNLGGSPLDCNVEWAHLPPGFCGAAGQGAGVPALHQLCYPSLPQSQPPDSSRHSAAPLRSPYNAARPRITEP